MSSPTPSPDPDMDGMYFLEQCDFDSSNRLMSLPEDRNKYGIILVFAYWCHNCAGIKPEYKILKDRLSKSNKIQFYVMNGTGPKNERPSRPSEQQLMRRATDIFDPLAFRGFPGVYLFDPSGKPVKEFNGPRTADGMYNFLKTYIKDL